jgi:hypothetical protein
MATDGKWYPPRLHPSYQVPSRLSEPQQPISLGGASSPKGITLLPGEQTLIVERPYFGGVYSLFVVTLGLYTIWWRRHVFVLTNQRVIEARGIVNRSVRSVPLGRIQDATLKRQLWVALIKLSSAGGSGGIETIGPLSNPGARRFQEALLTLAHSSGDGTGRLAGGSMAEELSRLAQLHVAGVLNDQEFAALKSKLIG